MIGDHRHPGGWIVNCGIGRFSHGDRLFDRAGGAVRNRYRVCFLVGDQKVSVRKGDAAIDFASRRNVR
jgi:hypothetical protein